MNNLLTEDCFPCDHEQRTYWQIAMYFIAQGVPSSVWIFALSSFSLLALSGKVFNLMFYFIFSYVYKFVWEGVVHMREGTLKDKVSIGSSAAEVTERLEPPHMAL